MGASNLPPGCGSADGGIDHEFEAAIEKLIDHIETVEEINALLILLPAVRSVISVTESKDRNP